MELSSELLTWSFSGAPLRNRSGRPDPAAVDVLVEPLADSLSRLTISIDFIGHGIGKVLVPLIVRREASKGMPDNMTALKQLIEAT